MQDHIWVLGAPDPEMEAIERLLREAGQEVIHATDRAGKRVHPGNAYAATTPQHEAIWRNGLWTIHAVECDWPHLDGETGDVGHIDHHRPGDSGYGCGPLDFLAASSIGQVYARLVNGDYPGPAHYSHGLADWTATVDTWWATNNSGQRSIVPSDIVLCAAADHCLAAAYRGECPGVDPDALMAWRIMTRAAFQRRSVEAVLADVAAARTALRDAPRVMIAGVPVADLGDRTVPELPEAAARDGVPFLATLDERGQRKTVLQVAPPVVVAAWMQEHPGAYGDPARGFAGLAS